MLLNNNKTYSEQFQIKMWETYYHVYDYLVNNGRRKSKKNIPKPIVEYFVKWRKVNEETV